MKKVSYQISVSVNDGTQENISLTNAYVVCEESELEVKLESVKSRAYNGVYSVEDIPDEPQEPTQLDRVEAQVTYTSMMTDTLLESEA